MLEFDSDLKRYVMALAERKGLPGQSLVVALENEDVGELARQLGSNPDTLVPHLAALGRALQADSDWGAGCKLLTDTTRAEVYALLTTLLASEAHF